MLGGGPEQRCHALGACPSFQFFIHAWIPHSASSSVYSIQFVINNLQQPWFQDSSEQAGSWLFKGQKDIADLRITAEKCHRKKSYNQSWEP
jgi:hypothetical protein